MEQAGLPLDTEIVDAVPVNEKKDVIVVKPGQMTATEALRLAEEQITFRKGLVKLIAAHIDPESLLAFKSPDGVETVYFPKAACQQILSWAGVNVIPEGHIIEKRYPGENGEYIDFEVWGDVEAPDGRRIRCMGNRATNDDFFGKAHGKIKPLEQIDVPSVKQSAITNMWNHALEVTGLKPSMKDLKDAGFDISRIGGTVKFKDGENGAAPAQSRMDGKPVISDAQAKRFYSLWQGKHTREQVNAKLKSIGAVSPSGPSDRMIPVDAYDTICKWAQNASAV